MRMIGSSSDGSSDDYASTVHAAAHEIIRVSMSFIKLLLIRAGPRAAAAPPLPACRHGLGTFRRRVELRSGGSSQAAD